MGGGGDKSPFQWVGTWGDMGGRPQKGITSYSMSPNRLRPMAGTGTKALLNSARRIRQQILYVAPPLLLAYGTLTWANERNEYLNSKAGRAEFGDEE